MGMMHRFFFLFLFCVHQSLFSQVIGLIGGVDGDPTTYAAYVESPPPRTVPILFPSSDPGAVIASVGLNSFGLGLLGGQDFNNGAYAAYTTVSGTATLIGGLPPMVSEIVSVALNEYGVGILGGVDNSGAAYAALVNPATHTASLIGNLPMAMGSAIQSVAINYCGSALIGGQAYAGFVDLETQTASSILGLPLNIEIHSVALNALGIGLIGGDDSMSAAYAAYVDAASNMAAPLAISPAELIESVAINDTGLGLIGGMTASGAYAAYTQLNNPNPIPISNLNLPGGGILSVAINDAGMGILGGYDSNGAAFAAFVNPNTFTASSVIAGLPVGMNSVINTVAINEFGQALIGGYDANTVAYAALVDPISNTATLLANLPTTILSPIQSVAILTHPGIPVQGLQGNDLLLANYLNTYARQAIFYFLPSICSGHLIDALESASPLRNAAFLWTADQNVFVLNSGLSRHLRNLRYVKNARAPKKEPVNEICTVTEDLLAVNEEQVPMRSLKRSRALSLENRLQKMPYKERPYTVWFDGIGAFAFQQRQEGIVGFDPFLGGFLFGLDKPISKRGLAGGGIGYAFTEIFEDDDQGHGHLNQEYFFVYAEWSDARWYADWALWLGFFQGYQVRKIHLSGVEFTAVSRPVGVQLAPHFELGYEKRALLDEATFVELVWNPFVMIDWVNAFQQRYEEMGAGPLNFAQKDQYSSALRSEVGLRFDEVFLFSSWKLIAEEKCAYANIASFGVGKMDVSLIGFPGSFTMETLSKAHNLAVIEATVLFVPLLQTHPFGSLSYQGEFGSSFQSHQIVGEIAWQF